MCAVKWKEECSATLYKELQGIWNSHSGIWELQLTPIYIHSGSRAPLFSTLKLVWIGHLAGQLALWARSLDIVVMCSLATDISPAPDNQLTKHSNYCRSWQHCQTVNCINKKKVFRVFFPLLLATFFNKILFTFFHEFHEFFISTMNFRFKKLRMQICY